MISTIQSFGSSFYQSLPKIPKITLDSPQNMVAKVQNLAVPALLLFGSSYLVQGALAIGGFTCVVCLIAGGGPICIPPCALALITIPIPAF